MLASLMTGLPAFLCCIIYCLLDVTAKSSICIGPYYILIYCAHYIGNQSIASWLEVIIYIRLIWIIQVKLTNINVYTRTVPWSSTSYICKYPWTIIDHIVPINIKRGKEPIIAGVEQPITNLGNLDTTSGRANFILPTCLEHVMNNTK